MSATSPASWRLWAGFFAMCTGMFMAVLDIQIVVTSLPEIQRALDIAPDAMSWVQTAYLIAEIIAIPLTGLLTRALTLRGLYAAALGVFTLASLACAASQTFEQLIAARIVQGFAGGLLIPAVFAAVFVLFAPQRQALATTIGGVMAVLAPTCGPLVGGWITQTLSWHWLFLVNILPGIAATGVVWTCLPRETPERTALRSLDGLGLAAMAVALGALEIGLKEAPQRGWLSPFSLGVLGLAGVSGVFFVLRSLRSAKPVVNLRALGDRDFAIGCVASFVLGAGLYGSVYLMPVFLAFVREHGPLAIGWTMIVTGLTQLAFAPVAVECEKRFDSRLLTFMGFAVFAIGLALSSMQSVRTDYDEMFWPQVVRGAAIMFCLLPPTRMALGHFAAKDVPDASGLFNVMRNLGGAIGIALIDTILFTRAPALGPQLLEKLKAQDAATLAALSPPADAYAQWLAGSTDTAVEWAISGLVQRAALTQAINEAWLLLAVLQGMALVAVLLATNRPKGAVGAH